MQLMMLGENDDDDAACEPIREKGERKRDRTEQYTNTWIAILRRRRFFFRRSLKSE